MAYVIRNMGAVSSQGEAFVDDTLVVYVETFAEASAIAQDLGWVGTITIDYLSDNMGEHGYFVEDPLEAGLANAPVYG